MVGCEWPTVIQESFCVFLHHGCSLEEHKRTVGQQINLDSKIKHIFPETRNHGLYYCADRVDDVTLSAIRAELVVDMIECNRVLEIDPLEEADEIFEHSELQLERAM